MPRALRNRWRTGAPVPGRWFSLAGDRETAGAPPDTPAFDPLEEEELLRDRVRLLAARWGVLCRPLLDREEGPMGWSRLLPAMHRLELAGELLGGRFFAGIPSLQFALPEIQGELEEAAGEDRIYWMNAADPASPAGLGIPGADKRLPARIAAARLCFRGAELIALSARGGRDLELFIPPEDPSLGEVLEGVTLPRRRAVNPLRKLAVETVNGAAAGKSPYAGALKELGFIPDRGKLILW
jgi:ATP-dependent Lhr-like helicase